MRWQACDAGRGYEVSPISSQCKCNTTAYPYTSPDANGTCICSPQFGYKGQPFFVSNITTTNPTGCLFCGQLARNPNFKWCKVGA
jgi:hypothetical protein